MIKLTPGKLWGMRRLADRNGFFMMTAVDQRPPIKTPIARHYGLDEAPYDDVARFKATLVQTMQAGSTAMLLDPHYAIPRGLVDFSPKKGLIVTLEDSLFEDTGNGRYSATIDNWSVAKIKRMGGDAVKLLAWYRPDADLRVNRKQQDFVKSIGEQCAHFDIPFLFELLVFPLAGDTQQTKDYIEMTHKRPEHVLESVAEFAKPEYGVDVFKLESPVAAANVPGVGGEDWQSTQHWFDELGQLVSRPWVMLSAGAGKEEFFRILTHAYTAGASGYLAGRAIWMDAFEYFPDWKRIRHALEQDASKYMKELNQLTVTRAQPWHKHACYQGKGLDFSPADSTFRQAYRAI
ncbi:MAG: tagatose 1,6-diphosphate aldolase [Arenicellales bacterium]|jgi:tagatose 1,6-diphosphate aldolase|nr:tagatose-bisphosphate aldolase [Acidiferrobacteraceae bacterium]MDP6123031.1 tagatose 1,6-diphosphate aldolase [Arenicellales bacterium]|tara:strand:- start:276 stop:1319 length:1044 start_codon:yes stop_codon:yes gene_type:complete